MNHNNFFFLILIFLMLLSGSSVAAKKDSSKKGLEAMLTLGTLYDDNTNEYSEKYLERFKNLEDTGRFHISSIDDGAVSAKFALKGKFNFFKKRQTTLDASAFYKMYMNNSIDQNGKFSVGLGQQVASKTYLHAAYSFVPHYYVCHFRDKDWYSILGNVPEAYQPFDYSKDALSFRVLEYLWKGSSLSGEFEYSRYYYNEHYTEYDSKRYSASIRGSQDFHKKIVVTLEYGYGYNDAKGYDGDITETKKSSDDADDSFNEHHGAVGAQLYLPELFNRAHTFSINGWLCYRDYTTSKSPEIDLTHAGRLENTLDASTAYTISIIKPVALQVEYSRIQRWTGSSYARNNDYIKNEKNYSKNVIALTLQYTIGR